MFDPTIYDNLKVVIEGYLYELDFSKKIMVINRKDIVDLASMSREFVMKFKLNESVDSYPFAEIMLKTSLEDFSKELLHADEDGAGCEIVVSLYTEVLNVAESCNTIERILSEQWEGRPLITQNISYLFGTKNVCQNRITLDFNRKINEQQIDDIPNIINYTCMSLEYLTNHYKTEIK